MPALLVKRLGLPAIMGNNFLTAEWRNLLFANYVTDPVLLKPYLPCHTELDDHNGNYYCSIVAFLFKDVRIKGIAFPFHRNFEEVNLRFYVRYKIDGKWERGVVFIKEIVPRRMISWVANTLYNENYVTLPMDHSWKESGDILDISYRWKSGKEWDHFSARADSKSTPLVPGSEEEFITEHYFGFTTINDKCSGMYRVAHPQWKIHRIMDYKFKCDVEKLYGNAFTDTLQQEPASVFLADGSAIEVKTGTKIFY
jgi:uncharacterized protein